MERRPALPASASMQLVRLMEGHLNALGLERETFRRQVGVCGAELLRVDARIDARRYRHALRLIERRSALSFFETRPSAGWTGWLANGWSDLATAISHAPSLGEALQCYVRYRPLVNDVDEMTVLIDKDRLVVRHTPDCSEDANLSTSISNLLMLREIVERYRLRVNMPVAVRFEIGHLGRRVTPDALDRVLQRPALLDNDGRHHQLVVHGQGLWAQDGESCASRWVHSLRALDAALDIAKKTTDANLLAARVEGIIESRWSEVLPIDGSACSNKLQHAVSATLGMSRWTLNRHLAAEGLEFSALVNNLRERRARILLSDHSISLTEVGNRLGFGSQSAFSRYYRSRRGKAPSEDRDLLSR